MGMKDWLVRYRPGFMGRTGKHSAVPIVIGATGGSGTRAFHGLLQRAGVFMGTRLNSAGDAMDFEPFLDDYIDRILRESRSLAYELEDLPPSLRQEVLSSFEKALQLYAGELPPGQPWGWKNPRSMYVFPIIHHFFPEMRFLHVVRDGRYMAFSKNKNQLRKHFSSLFGHDPEPPIEVSNARLWATTNFQVARWGEHRLASNYLRVLFEDLCVDPAGVAANLIYHLNLPNKDAGEVARGIEGPKRLGPWREAPPALLEEVTASARDTLKAFGYLKAE